VKTRILISTIGLHSTY